MLQVFRVAGPVLVVVCIFGVSCDGIGVVVGDLTGLSLKKGLGGREAVVAGIGLDSLDREVFYGNLDWVRYEGRPSPGEIMFYWGVGAGVVSRSSPRADEEYVSAGLRLPLGIDMFLEGASGDIFFELAPTFWLDAGDIGLGWAVGIRFLL